jgi:serine/threonine protein phosphatase PrpC
MPVHQMAPPPGLLDRKPYDDEIDVYGLTHTGKVRTDNQDHFLICALRKQMVVHQTSLPQTNRLMAGPERLAFLAMVADGVGGGARGEEASRIALEAVTQYVSGTMRCYYAAGSADDQEFFRALQEGALQCHQELKRRGEEDAEFEGMATTLTLYLGVWPKAYLLQVGDSRCYVLREGELSQITRDQTMAQELIDLGVLTRSDPAATRYARTLSSSLGGHQTDPVVTRLDMNWGTVVLLCSDGLTAHVSDDRIRERLRGMTSARQVCEELLGEALEKGGNDNISIIVGRAIQRTERTERTEKTEDGEDGPSSPHAA